MQSRVAAGDATTMSVPVLVAASLGFSLSLSLRAKFSRSELRTENWELRTEKSEELANSNLAHLLLLASNAVANSVAAVLMSQLMTKARPWWFLWLPSFAALLSSLCSCALVLMCVWHLLLAKVASSGQRPTPTDQRTKQTSDQANDQPTAAARESSLTLCLAEVRVA